MAAIGCLIPLVLLLAGAGIGGAVGGSNDAIWGGAAGVVVGMAGMLIALRGFQRARGNWPPE